MQTMFLACAACRGPAVLSKKQAGYLCQMDGLFATAGGWHSMDEYKDMLRELLNWFASGVVL
jgi:hypothetical protein